MAVLILTEIEGTEREVQDPVDAKDDHETDESPHDRFPSLFALCLVTCVRDKLINPPEEDDKGRRRYNFNERIDYLRDNLVEKAIENRHLLLTDLHSCLWCPTCWTLIVTKRYCAGENIDETPDRDHHKEADESPEHEILASCFCLIRLCPSNEGEKCAPEEDDEGEREEDWDDDVVDNVDDEGTDVREVVHRSEGDKREGEDRGKNECFFHRIDKWVTVKL